MSLRLAALVVSYDSAAFARGLVLALRAQWRALGGASEDLDVVVVDNASTRDLPGELAAVAAAGARVVESRENLGYARGMELALARARPSDAVLVANPDLAPFPGALARLLATLRERPAAGAVGPRAFLDPARAWLAPPNRLPTPELELEAARAFADPALRAAFSAERARHALREWTADAPLAVEMLSGACLLVPRAAIDAAGGLFDPRYPLYYEDTDLFRRLARAGRALWLEPRAEIVHHWARSSGIERGDPEPARRAQLARAAYFERWFAPEARDTLARADRLAASAGDAAEFQPLGACAAPPRLLLPRAGRWLIELALAPHFPLAAGAFAEGASFELDPRAWEWFYRGRYFLKATALYEPRAQAAWTFDKPAGARTTPLAPRELGAEDVGEPGEHGEPGAEGAREPARPDAGREGRSVR